MEVEKTRKFRLNAKRLYLTYPQCPIDLDTAMELLKDLFKQWTPTTIIVGQEKHSTGEKHLHVLVVLSETINVKDARFADLHGYHGNYQSVRSLIRTAKYVLTMRSFISSTSRDPKSKLWQTLLKFYLNDCVYCAIGDNRIRQPRMPLSEYLCNHSTIF